MRISDWSSDVCSSDLHGALQGPEINGLCGLPVDAMPAGGMQHGGRRTQPGHAAGQPPRHPCMGSQPVQLLQPRTAARTRQPQPPNLQLHRIRSEEHTSELKSLMRNSYALLSLQTKNTIICMKNY